MKFNVFAMHSEHPSEVIQSNINLACNKSESKNVKSIGKRRLTFEKNVTELTNKGHSKIGRLSQLPNPNHKLSLRNKILIYMVILAPSWQGFNIRRRYQRTKASRYIFRLCNNPNFLARNLLRRRTRSLKAFTLQTWSIDTY